MKYEEALEIITNAIQRDGMTIEQDKALSIAQKAIDNLIPKKPVKSNPICYAKTKDGKELHAYTYRCTVCYANVKIGTHHCSCGQALDWSDVE